MRSVALIVGGMLLAAVMPQQQERIIDRWVGTYQNQPLHFDFFADTMLLLNDVSPLYYRLTSDSLIAWGDTSFVVNYWFSMDRLLVLTEDNHVVTMSRQDKRARPIWGLWRGNPVSRSDETIELFLGRGGGSRWRHVGDDRWTDGEWSRRSVLLTFTWPPDSVVENGDAEPDSAVWNGLLDPVGGALLFDSTYSESGIVVMRKVYRW